MPEKLEESIGVQIRQHRKQFGFSLKELAEKTGVTPGFLGQVERGECNPSISTLNRIATALDTTISSFLPDEQNSHVNNNKPNNKKNKTNDDNQVVYIDMLCRDFKNKMEFFRSNMSSGASKDVYPLQEETEQIIYVLSGTLKVTLSNSEHIIHAGHYLYYDGNSLNKLEAISNEKVTYLTIITPPVERPHFRKIIQESPEIS